MKWAHAVKPTVDAVDARPPQDVDVAAEREFEQKIAADAAASEASRDGDDSDREEGSNGGGLHSQSGLSAWEIGT